MVSNDAGDLVAALLDSADNLTPALHAPGSLASRQTPSKRTENADAQKLSTLAWVIVALTGIALTAQGVAIYARSDTRISNVTYRIKVSQHE